MKKIALFLVSVLLMLGSAAGQNGNSTGRFEWARWYAPVDLYGIVGSVTDSAGNLYILGSAYLDSRWMNDEPLISIHNGMGGIGVMIAKISSDGEMVWKKLIHGGFCHTEPYDIKAVGDSAFSCLVAMPLASIDSYLYYLDTLIAATRTTDQTYPDYPMSSQGVGPKCLALITFDFEGNVLEQHFLQMSFLDYVGEDIFYVNPNTGDSDYLSTFVPEYASTFDIDRDGNIYLCHQENYTAHGGQNGAYYLINGTICAVKIWCDRRMVGIFPAESAMAGSPRVNKFSPHFDTLLGSRTVFQSIMPQTIGSSFLYSRIDRNGDLYMVGTLVGHERRFLVVDSVRDLFVTKMDENIYKGYLVRFDSTLTAKSCISLDDRDLQPNLYTSKTLFHDITFDYDSNLMFLTASTGRGFADDTVSYSMLTYQGTDLDRLKNKGFFMSFRIDDDSARMHSYGVVPSIWNSQFRISYFGSHGRIHCNKNRVFVQIGVGLGFRFPQGTISWDAWFLADGLGLVVFDYSGNVIDGYYYYALDPENEPGPIVQKDSILYLVNKINSDATFGDIHVPDSPQYMACIAKYVDTAFMTPYVRRVTEDTTIRVEVVQEEWTRVLYPNPTSGRVTVVMNGRPLRELYVAEMDGIAEPLPFSALGDGRYAADLTGRPDGVYVLVMISDEKHAYRSTVILQR